MNIQCWIIFNLFLFTKALKYLEETGISSNSAFNCQNYQLTLLLCNEILLDIEEKVECDNCNDADKQVMITFDYRSNYNIEIVIQSKPIEEGIAYPITSVFKLITDVTTVNSVLGYKIAYESNTAECEIDIQVDQQINCNKCYDVNNPNSEECILQSKCYYAIENKPGICQTKDSLIDGYYFKDSKFLQCSVSCNGCEDITGNCKTCNIDGKYFPVKGKEWVCLDEINKGNHFLSGGFYMECYKTCETCKELGNEEDSKCIECNSIYFKVANQPGLCVDESFANNNHYYNNKTELFEPCFETCNNCHQQADDNDHYCKDCKNGYLPFKNKPSYCLNDNIKKPNHILNGQEYDACFISCHNCTAVGVYEQMNCGSCLNNNEFKYYPHKDDSSQCYDIISKPTNTFLNDKKEIENCYQSCATCNRSGNFDETNCNTCLENGGYFKISNKTSQCINEEIQRKFYPNYVFSPSEPHFEPCFENCKYCSQPKGNLKDHKCDDCIKNYYHLVDNEHMCYSNESRPQGYYLNVENVEFKFEKCNSRCKICSELGNDYNNSKCIDCNTDNNYYSLYNITSHCVQLNEMPENFFLNTTTNVIDICFESCKSCYAKGFVNVSRCNSCDTVNHFYSLKEEISQCFNTTTKPENYFLNNEFKYEICYESCRTCKEKGNINDTKCNSCGYSYAWLDPVEQKMCVNEKTKPDNHKLNENGIYQSCLKNVLCDINCNHLLERWHVNETSYIDCIHGLFCNDYSPYYYVDTNRCVNACLPLTYEEPLTNYCVNCSRGEYPYFYQNKCYSKCPEGLISDSKNLCIKCPAETAFFSNGECVKDCDNAVGLICNPCRGYFDSNNKCVDKCNEGEDYDKNRKCIKKMVIDPRFNITHNPVHNESDILKHYLNQTLDTEYMKIMQKVLKLIDEKDNISEKMNYLVLFSEMVSRKIGSATTKDIEKLYLNAFYLNSNISSHEKQEDLTYDCTLSTLLAQYYLLKNVIYIPQTSLEQIKLLQYKVLSFVISYFKYSKNGGNDEDFSQKEDEILSIYSIILVIINSYQKNYNQFNPEFIPSLSKHLFYRIENTFLSNESQLSMKQLVDYFSVLAYKLKYPNYSVIKNDNISMITIPLEYIPNIPNSNLEVVTNCFNDIDIISSMGKMNVLTVVCIPKYELINTYKNALFISVTRYKDSYPLYNINATEISSTFISVNIYSKDYTKISIRSLLQPIKVYIDTLGKDNEYSYCIYFNETTKIPGNDCVSQSFGRYLLCTCNHLTDFGMSKINVEAAMSKSNLIRQAFKIINSTTVFKILNAKNSIVLYICGSILLIYFITVPFACIWDVRTYKQQYFDIVKRGLTFGDKIIIYDGMNLISSYFENSQSRKASVMSNADVEIQKTCKEQNETLNTTKKTLKDSSFADEIPVFPLKNYWKILGLFIYFEHRLFTLIISKPNYINRSNLLALFCIRKILLFALSAMTSTCVSRFDSPHFFQSMDYLAIFGSVVLVDILHTIFEIILARIPLDKKKSHHHKRIQINGIYSHILVYIVFIILISFGILNTLWISLEIEYQELVSMMYINYGLSIVFDLLIYEFIILGFKSLCYFIMIKTKEENNQGCFTKGLINFFGLFPWLFCIMWNNKLANSIDNKSEPKLGID